MTELKPYWNETYDYMVFQLGNQHRVRESRHLIKGIVDHTYKEHYNERYKDNNDIRLSSIMCGDFNGKKTYVSRIMQKMHVKDTSGKDILREYILGVLASRQDESCPDCIMGSFCDRSYAASYFFLSPEKLYLGYQTHDLVAMSCRKDYFMATTSQWESGGRTSAKLKMDNLVEKSRMEEGLELANFVYYSFMHANGSRQVTREVRELRNAYIGQLSVERPKEAMRPKEGGKLGNN